MTGITHGYHDLHLGNEIAKSWCKPDWEREGSSLSATTSEIMLWLRSSLGPDIISRPHKMFVITPTNGLWHHSCPHSVRNYWEMSREFSSLPATVPTCRHCLRRCASFHQVNCSHHRPRKATLGTRPSCLLPAYNLQHWLHSFFSSITRPVYLCTQSIKPDTLAKTFDLSHTHNFITMATLHCMCFPIVPKPPVVSLRHLEAQIQPHLILTI